MKQRLHILFLIVLLAWQGMVSQTYPVTLVPQVMPPAPIYFSSYADAGTINGPLRLQIVLNDLSQIGREIKLKAYFEGNGIAFESKDVIIGAPILFAEGGIPLLLTNVELAPYFTLQNITGISPAVYGQVIPEGSYQFCFEVYDVLTGTRISQKTCATTYIFQNDPPLLIAPNNQINIPEQNPLNLLFQWTPRHINVSNVQYELSIVEIWDQTTNPQTAFLGSPPIFRTTTTNTSYLYGPANPLLLSNKRYAWRVQAKAINGSEEIGLFKNNGYSEVYWFNYTAPCDRPENVRHEVKGAQQVNILWDDFTTDVPEFMVRYREKGNQNEWFFSRTNGNWVTLWDLRPGGTYEYQVYKKCLISESEYSLLQTFTTPEEDDETGLVDCGLSPDLNIENMEPLEQLFPGNVFKAGDFPIKVTETNGSNGRFSGKGYVTFPYFNSIKVAVNFTNVFINNENQLAEGTVITTYDPKWGNILDVDEVIDVAEDIVDVFTGGDNHDPIETDYEIDSEDISITDGQIVIVKPDGTTDTHDYDEGDTYTITDASGDEFTVDPDGNITQTGTGDSSSPLTTDNTDGVQSGTHTGSIEDPMVDTITNEAITVSFRTHKDEEDKTQFALDLVNNDYEKENYPKINTAGGTTYHPAHKAVVQGESDVFYADITINDSKINIDDLIIKTVKNKAIKHERLANTNTFKIKVAGVNPYRTEECVVTYLDPTDKKYKIAASFFVHHLKKHTETPVQVITVNGGNNLPNLEVDLNDIFGKAGGKFKVKPKVIDITIAQSDWDDNGNNVIDYNGSGIRSDYPQELKNIYKAFKKQYPGYDSQQYFLLVLGDEFKVSKPLSGFMPKTRQWGFLFEKHINDDTSLEKKDSALKVAAHELGHGVFTLEHPFGENTDNSGQASTWLMDYGNGTELGYPNWATMSDPSLKLMLFQDDQDGEYSEDQYLIGNAVVPNVFSQTQYETTVNTTNKNESCISFVSLANKLISIPTNAKDITFYHTGALYGFTILENGKWERYIGAYGSKNKNTVFKGYVKSTDIKIDWKKRVFKDYFSKNLGSKVTVHLGKLKRTKTSCGIDLYKKGGYTNTVDKGEKQWNSGGHDQTLIKSNQIGILKPYLTNINSPEACNLCPDGNEFYKTYSYLAKNEEDIQALTGIAKLVCSEGDDKIDYEVLVSQIYKNNADYKGIMSWLSKKAMYEKALEMYWNNNTNAFSGYLYALQQVSKDIKKYHKKLNNGALSKDDLYAGLFYLNDNFLKSLSLQDKKELLTLVFKHNTWWISENTFGSGKSDKFLIHKILKNIPNKELSEVIKEVGLDSGDRDRVLYMGYGLTSDHFKHFSVSDRLKILQITLDGPVLDDWSLHSTEELVLNIINSVESKDAEEFLKGLVKELYRVNGDLLYKQLVDKLNDSFIGDDTNRLNLVIKLKDLVFAAKNIDINSSTTITDDDQYQSLLDQAQCKANYYWNVKNERFLWLFNVVNDQSKLEFRFIEEQKKINLRQGCKKTSTLYYGDNYSKKICTEWDTDEPFEPFELVAIEIIDDITFTRQSGACNNNGAIICGKVALVPAMFIDYLDRNKNNTIIQNGVFNALTVASFYFSGGAIIKAGGAFNVTTYAAYADLFVTSVNPYFADETLFVAHATAAIQSVFKTEKENAKQLAKVLQTFWNIGATGFTIDTGLTTINPKEHLEAIATYKALIKKIGKSKTKKIIAKDPKLSEKAAKGFEQAEKNARKSPQASKSLDDYTDQITKEIDKTVKISEDLSTPLKNKLLDLLLQDDSNLKKSIIQLNSDLDFDKSVLNKLNHLNIDNGKGGKLITDFDEIATKTLDAKKLDDLIEAWNILRYRSSKIAKTPENSEILAKVADRFTYGGEDGFKGLEKLFNKGSQVQSKQKLINGLKETDIIFEKAANIPVKFSAIKKGEITIKEGIKVVDKSGRGDEVARYVDGILQKKKTLDDGEVVGKYDGDDILQKGREVGFRSFNSTLDYSQMDISGAMAHVKYRDPKVPRKKGIGGCHDAAEWNKIRQVHIEGYTVPKGKSLNDPEVPEIIIRSETPHPNVPGVKLVEYSIPSIDGKLTDPITKKTIGNTTGATKNIRDPKTLYDPKIWTDSKLEKALKEALEHVVKHNKIIPREWSGMTREGIRIRGYYNNGKITSFFFE